MQDGAKGTTLEPIVTEKPVASTPSRKAVAASLLVLGAIIAISTVVGGSALSASTKHGPKLFNIWFRHLTNWNAMISSLWFIVVGILVLHHDNPMSPTMLSFGYATTLLNLFVFFVRCGWFRISNARTHPHHFFSDIIIHALVPLATCVLFAMLAPSIAWTSHTRPVAHGIIAFWVILCLWYLVNYLLEHYGIVQWPYLNGAGKGLPQDIYP